MMNSPMHSDDMSRWTSECPAAAICPCWISKNIPMRLWRSARGCVQQIKAASSPGRSWETCRSRFRGAFLLHGAALRQGSTTRFFLARGAFAGKIRAGNMKTKGVLVAIVCGVWVGSLGDKLCGQGLGRNEAGYLTPLKFQVGEAQFGNWKISASSRLANQGRFTYGPGNVFLTGAGSAWVEGVAGDGIGQWLHFDLDYPQLFSKVIIRNGYQRTDKAFRENGRVKELRLTWPAGQKTVLLRDMKGSQSILLKKGGLRAPWVRLEIVSVYRGSKYRDTAISSVRFNIEDFNEVP